MILSTTAIVLITIGCIMFSICIGVFICYSQEQSRAKAGPTRLNTAKRRSRFVRGLRPSLAEKGELPRPKSANAQMSGYHSRHLKCSDRPRRVSEVSISYKQRQELLSKSALDSIPENEPRAPDEMSFVDDTMKTDINKAAGDDSSKDNGTAEPVVIGACTSTEIPTADEITKISRADTKRPRSDEEICCTVNRGVGLASRGHNSKTTACSEAANVDQDIVMQNKNELNSFSNAGD
ncbi:hypothetical protein SNE40_023352 [Patella caerulea]|uniref:Uncharacterized protein n=1 Tax=Patella caerulea TaxID=87958 RepID=A0AAN8GBZ8_PATCE